MTSNSPNDTTVDNELGAVDRGSAIQGQLGDEIGDLTGLSGVSDRDAILNRGQLARASMLKAAFPEVPTLRIIPGEFGDVRYWGQRQAAMCDRDEAHCCRCVVAGCIVRDVSIPQFVILKQTFG